MTDRGPNPVRSSHSFIRQDASKRTRDSQVSVVLFAVGLRWPKAVNLPGHSRFIAACYRDGCKMQGLVCLARLFSFLKLPQV
jgi:hypothetical protein